MTNPSCRACGQPLKPARCACCGLWFTPGEIRSDGARATTFYCSPACKRRARDRRKYLLKRARAPHVVKAKGQLARAQERLEAMISAATTPPAKSRPARAKKRTA